MIRKIFIKINNEPDDNNTIEINTSVRITDEVENVFNQLLQHENYVKSVDSQGVWSDFQFSLPKSHLWHIVNDNIVLELGKGIINRFTALEKLKGEISLRLNYSELNEYKDCIFIELNNGEIINLSSFLDLVSISCEAYKQKLTKEVSVEIITLDKFKIDSKDKCDYTITLKKFYNINKGLYEVYLVLTNGD